MEGVIWLGKVGNWGGSGLICLLEIYKEFGFRDEIRRD